MSNIKTEKATSPKPKVATSSNARKQIPVESTGSSLYVDTNGGKYTQGIISKAGQKSFFVHYFSGGSVTNNVTDRKDAFTKEQYSEHIVIK